MEKSGNKFIEQEVFDPSTQFGDFVEKLKISIFE
jgi:hypothetical protein